jgi:hypothetical protein
MLLTNSKIQTAIIKAYYNLALKSIKYYAGLAVGVNNTCLLKQARLLRMYISILKCFKIIGSTTECNCYINGNYSVTLDNNLIYNFQFLNDGTGTLITPWNTYSFIYQFDCKTNKLYISFPTIFEIYYESITTITELNFPEDEVITVIIDGDTVYTSDAGFDNLEDFIEDFNQSLVGSFMYINDDGFVVVKSIQEVENLEISGGGSEFVSEFTKIEEDPIFEELTIEFDENCNFNLEEGFPWYYETTLDITGTPVPFDDDVRFFTLFDPYGNTIFSLDVPITWTFEEIVTYWNNTSPYNDIYLQYIAPDNLYFYTDFGVYYNNYSMLLQQYEGGTDSNCIFSIDVSTLLGPGLLTIIVDGVTIYNSNEEFTTVEEFITYFNDNNTLGITVSSPNALQLSFTSPEYSFEEYNGIVVEIFNYKGIYSEYNETYAGGIDPDLQSYQNTFSLVDSSEDFINNNPCEPETVEQTCLSNKDVVNIIKHIDRIIK